MKQKRWVAAVLVGGLLVWTPISIAGQRAKRPAKPKAPAATKPAASPESAAPEGPPQQPAHNQPEVQLISVDELKAKLEKNEPVTIIDSRSEGSYEGAATKIKGAIRIPSDQVVSRLKEIPADTEVVIYCT